MTQKHTPTILIVDDEDDILELLAYNLEKEGYRTLKAKDGVSALKIADPTDPDLILLDLMMPLMDGLETCKQLREKPAFKEIPIIMLTARTEEIDHVSGLEAGADIYLTKPISIPVLLSQVKAALRGSDKLKTKAKIIRIHDLIIDRDRYRIEKTGTTPQILQLPKKEFELVHFLASRPGHVYSRQHLLNEVWGSDVFVVDRTVDVHVRKIREKIGDHYIETIKGVGYRFLA